MSRPVSISEESKTNRETLHKQLTLLLQLIYETKHCSVEIAEDESWIKFKAKNNGYVSRGNDGAHAAAMNCLFFAL